MLGLKLMLVKEAPGDECVGLGLWSKYRHTHKNFK